MPFFVVVQIQNKPKALDCQPVSAQFTTEACRSYQGCAYCFLDVGQRLIRYKSSVLALRRWPRSEVGSRTTSLVSEAALSLVAGLRSRVVVGGLGLGSHILSLGLGSRIIAAARDMTATHALWWCRSGTNPKSARLSASEQFTTRHATTRYIAPA
jgi:hypothetical protein